MSVGKRCVESMNLFDIPPLISFREWLGLNMARRQQSEVEKFAICAWQIWCARNELCFEKVYISPDLCSRRASDLLLEYRRANSPDVSVQSRRSNAKWIPPEFGSVKVNVDAAINLKEGRFGVGVVARNSDGNVMLSASKTIGLFILWSVLSSKRSIGQ